MTLSRTSKSVSGTIYCNGIANAPVLFLEEPLSFWGGYDPQTGKIIDQHHPQVGSAVRNCIMVLPGSRGSAGTPAGLAESIRIGTGPAGIISLNADINFVAGLITATKLYGIHIPYLTVAQDDFHYVSQASHLRIKQNGTIELT